MCDHTKGVGSGVFDLQILCSAFVVRSDLDLSYVNEHRTCKIAELKKNEYQNATLYANRTSGCLIKMLASYERSTDVWGDPRGIQWLAGCNHILGVYHIMEHVFIVQVRNCSTLPDGFTDRTQLSVLEICMLYNHEWSRLSSRMDVIRRD